MITESTLLNFIKKKKLGCKTDTKKIQCLTTNKVIYDTLLIEYAFFYRYLDVIDYLLDYKPFKSYYINDNTFCTLVLYISQFGYPVSFFEKLLKFNKDYNKIITKNLNIIVNSCIININIPLFNYFLVHNYYIEWKNLFTYTYNNTNYYDFFKYIITKQHNNYISGFINNLKKSLKKYTDSYLNRYEVKDFIIVFLNNTVIEKKSIDFLLDLMIKDIKYEESNLFELIHYYFDSNPNIFICECIFNYIVEKFLVKEKEETQIDSLRRFIRIITNFINTVYYSDDNNYNVKLNKNYKYYNFVKNCLIQCEKLIKRPKMKVVLKDLNINNIVSKKNSLRLVKYIYRIDQNIFNRYDDSYFSPIMDVCKYGDYNTYLFVKQHTNEKFYIGKSPQNRTQNIINLALYNCDTRILKDTLNYFEIIKKYTNDSFYQHDIITDLYQEHLTNVINNKDKKLLEKIYVINTLKPLKELGSINSILFKLKPKYFFKLIKKYSITLNFLSNDFIEDRLLEVSNYFSNDKCLNFIFENVSKETDLNKKIKSLKFILDLVIQKNCVLSKLEFITKIINILKQYEKIEYNNYFFTYLFCNFSNNVSYCLKHANKCPHCSGTYSNCLQNNIAYFSTKIKFNTLDMKFLLKSSKINNMNYTVLMYIFSNNDLIKLMFKNGLFPILDNVILIHLLKNKYGLKLKFNKIQCQDNYVKYKKIYILFNLSARKHNIKYKNKHTENFKNTLEHFDYCPEFNCDINNFNVNKNVPIHADPNNLLKLIKCNDTIYITEKADGIPSKINLNRFYPYVNYNDLHTKVYAEEVLVNDTKINFVYGDFEFINKLRKIHPYIAHARDTEFGYNDSRKIKITSIFKLNDNDYIYAEKDSLYTFINENKHKNNLWWPKLVWKIDKEFLLYNYDLIKNKENNIFNTDGWIVFDKNKDNIIKIKPDKHLTIDLLYINNQFNSCEYIPIPNVTLDMNKIFIKDCIYRCYYDKSLLSWIPKDLRKEKRKANPIHVINQINSYFTNSWEKNIELLINLFKKVNYYQIYDTYTTINMRSNDIDHFLKNISCKNPNILDIGCGFKCLKYKKIINPHKYYGIDNDIKLIDFYSNTDACNFQILDISEDWNKQLEFFNNNKMNEERFNVFLVLNSIQNCYNNIDSFLEEITKRADKNAICLVRFLDFTKLKEILKNKSFISYNNNYVRLEKDNMITYYYSKYHLVPLTEHVFEKNQIVESFKNYGWIVSKHDNKELNKDNEWNNYLNCFSIIEFKLI